MPAERTRYYATRPRRVPPEFCTDEGLESCSLLAALLLYRLISQADDQGRLPGHPTFLRAVCFPMRPDVSERKVALALDELAAAGFVIRYDLKGKLYLQIGRWFDLQGKWGQRRTYPSRYPAPPGWTHDWVNAGTGEDEVRAPGAPDAGDVRPPSPLPSPSSLATPFTGLNEKPPATGRLGRLRKVLEQANHERMTTEEAFKLGASPVDDARSPRRVR